ncbi:SMI1/KNR4 family protein [Muribacter muris]|uniref:SMI1/KNR4 family protein n=1 Tax=Muribacter muris TaxID=67855 RepID=A0A4Y9JV60_9PAST|nr:SMI1/KNR4 family protein [Muribacter muris]MBF0785885.1 SMI1/KNR4 family protein [Muribacter muris]MBF0827201.1 SMI1/KNR4 family protein [Muribacter muris]TFV08326.1 SMI1/KNR4 family protein [Muribacter muris]
MSELTFKKYGLSPEEVEMMEKHFIRLDKRRKKILIRAYESNYRVSEQEIADFECVIGYKLPIDYVQFLLKFNGGDPSKPCISELDVISYFLCFKSEDKSASLVDIYSNTDVEILEEIKYYGLPIATTVGGNFIVLSPDGKIYFFDHEIPYYEGEPLELICNGFTELLECLTEDT